ncbi:MAG: hypothetical protein Q7U74_09405 [Saprospiraceae bacterium]|nr:hypothetical protein [Saprospiraceae bacterium]
MPIIKTLLTLWMLFSLLTNLGAANPAPSPKYSQTNPFQDELSRIDASFSKLQELESRVETCRATYTQLAAEGNPLLHFLQDDHQDISSSLLEAGGRTESAVGIVLLVLGIIVALVVGCCLLIVAAGAAASY